MMKLEAHRGEANAEENPRQENIHEHRDDVHATSRTWRKDAALLVKKKRISLMMLNRFWWGRWSI